MTSRKKEIDMLVKAIDKMESQIISNKHSIQKEVENIESLSYGIHDYKVRLSKLYAEATGILPKKRSRR